MRTVRERLQARIDALDRILRVHARAVDPADRDERWHATVDEVLAKRSALMAQRDMGFMVTDRRRVRG